MVASTYTILATESTEVRVDPLDTVESNPVIDVSKMEETKKFIENIKGGNKYKVLIKERKLLLKFGETVG